MSPTIKSKTMKTRSSNINVPKVDKSAWKMRSSILPKTSKQKKNIEAISSSSFVADSTRMFSEKSKKSKTELRTSFPKNTHSKHCILPRPKKKNGNIKPVPCLNFTADPKLGMECQVLLTPIKTENSESISPSSSLANCTYMSTEKSKKSKSALKTSSPKKKHSKLRTLLKTPIKNENIESISSSSFTANSSPMSTNESTTPTQGKVSKKIVNYYLNAYKQSPNYADLKNKRFNTSFLYETRRGDRDIQIFTPEEDNDPKWRENWPDIDYTFDEPGSNNCGDILMSIPGIGISDSDEDEKPECSKKGKRGRKKMIGYKGVPMSDECLLMDNSSWFESP